MKKSTHSGICQVCGRRQHLPAGRLSKHGYQIKQRGMGGYFVGTCRGSDCLLCLCQFSGPAKSRSCLA